MVKSTLLEQARNGNEEAIRKIVEVNMYLIEVYLKRVDTSVMTLEEWESTVFILLYDGVKSYFLELRKSYLNSYLNTFITNGIRDLVRDNKKTLDNEVLNKWNMGSLLGVYDNEPESYPLDMVITKEEYQRVREGLLKLGVKEQSVIKLYFGFDGTVRNSRETALASEYSSCYVNVHIRNGLNKLKYINHYSEDLEDIHRLPIFYDYQHTNYLGRKK